MPSPVAVWGNHRRRKHTLGRKGGYYKMCSTLYILYGNIHNARQGLFLVYRLCIEYSSCINIQYISTGFHLFT